MFRTNLRLILWGALGSWAAAACAADPWQNCRIMPKSDQLLIRDGREITGDVYQIAWPATVERIEGQWLKVVDNGGYRVPAVSGWVSKDEVLKFDEAHAHYMESLRTADAPWVHWLVGICLEERNESETAQEEYLKSLSAAPGDTNAVRMAVRTAVEMNPNLLDPAIRLERLKATEAKSAEEAVAAAGQIQSLSEAAARSGIRRPHALFEQAEALHKAFRLKLAEERKNTRGIDEQIARAISEIDGGTSEDRDLFNKAEQIYRLTASVNPDDTQAGPHCWKGCMGRAELYLSRVAFLDLEAWSLIGLEPGSPGSFSGTAATSSANRLGATTMPIDLKMLDAFFKNWQDPKQRPAIASRAHAVCVCLAVEIQLLHSALKCFDEAVRLSPDLVEAYRDRGLAYLALARCEAILASIEEGDPDLHKQLANLDLEGALLPQKLDRALVDGRKHFNEVLDKLPVIKAKEALIATEKQDLANAVEDMAKNCVTAAVKHGGSDAKEQKKGEAAAQPPSSLMAVQEQLAQLRIDAAKLEDQLDQDEKKVKEDLSKANAALDESYAMLDKSEYLRQAEQSARTACGKGNFASAESLKVLAAIYASQCNFDRASFYQKLAVIFASEDERPQLLRTLHDYEKMDDLITEKAKAKTPPSPGGQGKGSKSSGGGQSGDGESGGGSSE
jgi:tetratricopeptide (TPR) repeat protein